MLLDSKSKEILHSAAFNAVSNLCSNLLFLFIVHFMASYKDNPTLHSSGINIGMSLISIIFDSFVIGFGQALKILYSQLDGQQKHKADQLQAADSPKEQLNQNLLSTQTFSSNKQDQKIVVSFGQQNEETPKTPAANSTQSRTLPSNNKNILLYQTTLITCLIGTVNYLIISAFIDYFLGDLLSYELDVIEYTKIGALYFFVSRFFMTIFEFTRSQFLGLKIFGPFAVIQAAAFFIVLAVCFFLPQIGIHEAGLLFVSQEILKVIFLFVYLKQHDSGNPFCSFDVLGALKMMLRENRRLIEMLYYVRPLIVLIFFEFIFFNVSIVLSGKYDKEYVIACVCFTITNNLIYKGVCGICESVVSFCGMSLMKRNYVDLKQYLAKSMAILLIFEFICIAFLLIYSKEWAECFSLDPIVISIIDEYKYFYFITIIADGFQLIYASYLQSLEMKEYVAKVTTISYDFLGIPLMFLLANGLDLKVGGIWLAVGIANMVNSGFFFWKGGQADLDQQYKLALVNHACEGEDITTQGNGVSTGNNQNINGDFKNKEKLQNSQVELETFGNQVK